MSNINENKTVNVSATSNKTLTLRDSISAEKVTAVFSVDPLATPNSFPSIKVLPNTQLIYSPGSPVKSGFLFNGWSPSLPRTISETTTFTAQFATATTTTLPPAQTVTPTTATVGATQNTVNFNITNNDDVSATISWVIRLGTTSGTVVASNSQSVASGSTIQVSATGLSSDTTYWLTDVTATGINKTVSTTAVNRFLVTDPTPITATPTTSVGAVTNSSVNFNITNNDAATATISWLIRLSTETGQIVASNTVSVASGASILATATGLGSGNTYWLTDVKATASGKQISAEAVRRSVTTTTTTTTTTTEPPTAQPSFENISSTTNSISFRARNNDALSVTMAVTNQSTQDFLFSGTVAGNTTTSLLTQSGLSQNTSYTFNINANASGKTPTNKTQSISTAATTTTTTTTTTTPTTPTPPPPPTTTTTTTTAAPCPPNGTVLSSFCSGTVLVVTYANGSCGSTQQAFPNHPSCAPATTTTTTAAPPPTTTTTAAPTTTTTTSGFGCLDLNTPIRMFNGSTKLLKNIKVGDELLGYYIDGMLDESNPYWQYWYAPLSAEGNFEKTVVTGVIPSSYHQYFIINNDIRITKSHPLFVNQAGTDTWNWIDTPYIKVGDKLKGVDGSTIEITSYEVVNDFIEVVTLDVENIDNYFAGQTPVLVHNNIVKQ
jgi:hypothetical protein